MRQPDVDALIHFHENGDLQASINLMTLFCRASTSVDSRIATAMAAILKKAGPAVRIEQALRNSQLLVDIHTEALDRGSREKAYQSVSGSSGLSIGRLRKIDRGVSGGSPLTEFIKEPLAATHEQLVAAQKYMARLRTLLLSDSTKGREKRTLLNVSGWRDLGKSAIHEEIFQDVENLLQLRVKPKDAHVQVAKNSGETKGNVRKIHQRMKAERRRDLEEAAEAVNKEAIRCGGHPFVSPSDMDHENRDKTAP